MAWDRQCVKDSEQKDHSLNEWMNEWMNYEGVYRTAPATPGLLIRISDKLFDDLVVWGAGWEQLEGQMQGGSSGNEGLDYLGGHMVTPC